MHPLRVLVILLVATLLIDSSHGALDKTLAKLKFDNATPGPIAETEFAFDESLIGDAALKVYVPEGAKPAEVVKVVRPDGIQSNALRLTWGPSLGRSERGLPALIACSLDLSGLSDALDKTKSLTFEMVLRTLTDQPGIFVAFNSGFPGNPESYSGCTIVSADCTPRDGAPAFQWKLGSRDLKTGENLYSAVSPLLPDDWTTARITFANRADGVGFDVTLAIVNGEGENSVTEQVTVRDPERQGEVPDELGNLVSMHITVGDHDPNREEIPFEILSMRISQP